MRVVFMGTPAFAVPSLQALISHHDVVLVVTRPDRPGGRGGAPRPPEVKIVAEAAGIDVFQPSTLRGAATETIAAVRPDVVCVAAFGMLLPVETLHIAPFGCINVHASLLPAYRGAAPIQRAILAGDQETGVSIMSMEEGLDTGPYLCQRRLPIADRYADEIETDLAQLGADALLDALSLIETGDARWTVQDADHATYAPKVTKDDVALLPDLPVAEALLRVRAATRRAPARACLGDRELTVVRASPAEASVAPGAVCLAEGVPALGFADGALALDRVRPAGKADMPGAEWARGARLDEGACWRCTR